MNHREGISGNPNDALIIGQGDDLLSSSRFSGSPIPARPVLTVPEACQEYFKARKKELETFNKLRSGQVALIQGRYDHSKATIEAGNQIWEQTELYQEHGDSDFALNIWKAADYILKFGEQSLKHKVSLKAIFAAWHDADQALETASSNLAVAVRSALVEAGTSPEVADESQIVLETLDQNLPIMAISPDVDDPFVATITPDDGCVEFLLYNNGG